MQCVLPQLTGQARCRTKLTTRWCRAVRCLRVVGSNPVSVICSRRGFAVDFLTPASFGFVVRGHGCACYRRMIEVSAAGRPGTPDEVANVAALLMGPDGGFITGSDILMDGGVTAAYWFGELALQ